MKKTFIITFSLLTVAALWSCKKEYQVPGAFSDANVRTSFARDPMNTAIGSVQTFADLSQGVLTRNWYVSAGNEITGTVDSTSSAKTIYIRFNKAGLQNVRLVNTFADSVTVYRKDGTNYRSKTMDTTMVVTVFESIVVNYTVSKNGVVITDPVITIKAGETLVYTDNSAGLPDTYNWNFGGGTPASASTKVATVKYDTPGTYSVTSRVSRTTPLIPPGSATVVKTDYIKVVP